MSFAFKLSGGLRHPLGLFDVFEHCAFATVVKKTCDPDIIQIPFFAGFTDWKSPIFGTFQDIARAAKCLQILKTCFAAIALRMRVVAN